MAAYQDEIESDMSVFHRIDDMGEQPGPRMVRLARCLPVYQGAVRMKMLAARKTKDEEEEQDAPGESWPADAPRVGPRPGSLFSFATSGGPSSADEGR